MKEHGGKRCVSCNTIPTRKIPRTPPSRNQRCANWQYRVTLNKIVSYKPQQRLSCLLAAFIIIELSIFMWHMKSQSWTFKTTLLLQNMWNFDFQIENSNLWPSSPCVLKIKLLTRRISRCNPSTLVIQMTLPKIQTVNILEYAKSTRHTATPLIRQISLAGKRSEVVRTDNPSRLWLQHLPEGHRLPRPLVTWKTLSPLPSAAHSA